MKKLPQNNIVGSLFIDEYEAKAIERIRKFAKLAKSIHVTVEVGFSGGKDSIVLLDLVKRSGIDFVAVFNYAFEDPDVVNFIKTEYPEVIIQKKNTSYFQLIKEKGFFPESSMRYCCDYFKENSENATITGVRRYESKGRKGRKVFTANKTFYRTNKEFDVFSAECSSVYKGEIQLKPIVDWNDNEVWLYIKKNRLPYPKLYNEAQRRCGCMMCPLATLNSNLYYFKKYPNLLSFAKHISEFSDLTIHKTGVTYTPEQFLFCWLNHFEEPSERWKKAINSIYNRNMF